MCVSLRVDVFVSTSITVHYHGHLLPSMYNFYHAYTPTKSIVRDLKLVFFVTS